MNEGGNEVPETEEELELVDDLSDLRLDYGKSCLNSILSGEIFIYVYVTNILLCSTAKGGDL